MITAFSISKINFLVETYSPLFRFSNRGKVFNTLSKDLDKGRIEEEIYTVTEIIK